MEFIMLPCICCGKESDTPDNMCMSCQRELRIWTMHRYNVYCEQVKNDLQNDNNYTDEIVLDIAKVMIRLNPELKIFIEEELGAKDAVGRLVNDI